MIETIAAQNSEYRAIQVARIVAGIWPLNIPHVVLCSGLLVGGRRLFSFRHLISKMGLIYLLSVSFMILSVLAVNLIPNDPILRNLRLSLPSENYSVLFGSSPTDQWAECNEATVGINYELRLIERSLLSPVLGNCEGTWKLLKEMERLTRHITTGDIGTVRKS